MTWWDIIKFQNNLGPLLDALKHHHETTGRMAYVPPHDMKKFVKLYGEFTRMLKNPNIDLNDLDKIAIPMEQYYSLLVRAPEFHHREFGNLYTQIFDTLRELNRLGGEGDGI